MMGMYLKDYSRINYAAIFMQRSALVSRMRSNPRNFALMWSHYKTHPADFINDILCTSNPEIPGGGILPFILFPRQRELIDFFQERKAIRRDGVVEKCRNVGVTWVMAAYMLWMWIFYPGSEIGVGSLRADSVDKIDDMDSIFEKIRFMMREMPVDFMPRGFKWRLHSKQMLLTNPENGSHIKGSCGQDIGRGGRNTIFFIDEAAHLGQAEKVDAALSENSQCKIWASTPRGMGNLFYNKAHDPTGYIKKFTFSWFDDPRKTREWLEYKRATTSKTIFAQEYLIDYAASLSGTFIPKEYLDSCIDYAPDSTGRVRVGLDVADEGDDNHALVVRRGICILRAEEWNEGMPNDAALRVWGLCKANGWDYIKFDANGVGAGAHGKFRELMREDPSFKIRIDPVKTQSSPTPGTKMPKVLNKDYYLNYRSQLWDELRTRAEKTHEMRTGVRTDHKEEDLISLPRNSKLIQELSTPMAGTNKSGKLQIESKDEMRSRGVKSPNLADACVLAFAPDRNVQIRRI